MFRIALDGGKENAVTAMLPHAPVPGTTVPLPRSDGAAQPAGISQAAVVARESAGRSEPSASHGRG